MTLFISVFREKNKGAALLASIRGLAGAKFEVSTSDLRRIDGSPFAYWLTERLRKTYSLSAPFESAGRTAKQGLATTNDFRFIRAWWEVQGDQLGNDGWAQFARSGGAARFYGPSPLVINWNDRGRVLKSLIEQRYGNIGKRIYNEDHYFRPGFCWPLRGSRLSVKAIGPDSVFGIASKMAFVPAADQTAFLAILNSSVFNALLKVQAGSVGGIQFESGLISRIPVPPISVAHRRDLDSSARRAWSLVRRLDSQNETSHAFHLPGLLQVSGSDRFKEWANLVESVNRELVVHQELIDEVVLNAYGLSNDDKGALETAPESSANGPDDIGDIDTEDDDSNESDGIADPAELQFQVLMWSVGVVFGRFDLRLVTGERTAPQEPAPFDPLPTKSPGMLPDGAEPFHAHNGILLDDQGHPHDLTCLVEEVLGHLNVTVSDDIRRWMQRDFFAFHLQRYSRSRRKAPIYWPLSSASGSYTLWVYYPSLTGQTLYRTINDFVEPKLKQVGDDITGLRNKGAARSREDEKQFEALQVFELELLELRDTLLNLAPTFKPNHDDGVQITAAPLWPLFRHKPWQKVLKDTWAKLEKGDCDWAHMAMNYWPERVREKCKTDKSLAIAHGLENLYVELEAKPKKARSKK